MGRETSRHNAELELQQCRVAIEAIVTWNNRAPGCVDDRRGAGRGIKSFGRQSCVVLCCAAGFSGCAVESLPRVRVVLNSSNSRGLHSFA